MSIYEHPYSQSLIRMDRDDLPMIEAMWKFAKDGAETEEQLEHVLRSEISWRYWKACNFIGEFSSSDNEKRMSENEKLYNDFVKFGIKRLSEGEGGLIKEEKIDFMTTPDKWK